jgi:hypothetical protein
MSVNKHKTLASECVDKQAAEKENQLQAETFNNNELAA